MDQISWMRVFNRVVEAGGFTKAAESLNLPKGTVTKHIQNLESHLKVKLLNRTTRSVTVTPAGAVYYERAMRLLGELDELEASMSNSQQNPSGRLRIDIPTSVARLVIIPQLPSFCERYPDIQIDVGVSDRPVDLIADNVDVVIRGGDLMEQSLVARRVGSIHMVTAASPDYLKRYGVPKHPKDLDDQGHVPINYFSARTGKHFANIFEKDGESIEFKAKHRISINEANAVVDAALAGLGISQLARFHATEHLESGKLVEVLPDWLFPPFPIYVVYPPNRHLSAKVRAFVDWTVDLFSNHPHF